LRKAGIETIVDFKNSSAAREILFGKFILDKQPSADFLKDVLPEFFDAEKISLCFSPFL